GKCKPSRPEERPRERLDEQIAPRDRHSACPAPAPKRRERNERDVVVPGYRCPAGRAGRSRIHEASTLRHPGDNDVQEAADHQASDEKETDHAGPRPPSPKIVPATGISGRRDATRFRVERVSGAGRAGRRRAIGIDGHAITRTADLELPTRLNV